MIHINSCQGNCFYLDFTTLPERQYKYRKVKKTKKDGDEKFELENYKVDSDFILFFCISEIY